MNDTSFEWKYSHHQYTVKHLHYYYTGDNNGGWIVCYLVITLVITWVIECNKLLF